jgi:hypothetical protein
MRPLQLRGPIPILFRGFVGVLLEGLETAPNIFWAGSCAEDVGCRRHGTSFEDSAHGGLVGLYYTRVRDKNQAALGIPGPPPDDFGTRPQTKTPESTLGGPASLDFSRGMRSQTNSGGGGPPGGPPGVIVTSSEIIRAGVA